MRAALRTRAIGVIAVLIVVAAALPASAAAAPAQSSVATYTFFTFNRVPIVNVLEVGTLRATLRGTPSSFTIDWSYRGTTNGSPAFASGTGSGFGSASKVTLNLDSISQWSMPGFAQPDTGKTAFLTRTRFPFSTLYSLDLYDFPNFPHFIVSGVPIFLVPYFSGPLSRPQNFFFESSLGGGETDISTLPGSRTPSVLRYPSQG